MKRQSVKVVGDKTFGQEAWQVAAQRVHIKRSQQRACQKQRNICSGRTTQTTNAMRFSKILSAFVSLSGIILVLSEDHHRYPASSVTKQKNSNEADNSEPLQQQQQKHEQTKAKRGQQQQTEAEHADKGNKQLIQPYPGPKLVSFEAVGKNVLVGLDYLVPFIEVPVKRKRNAPPRPLVIINSAAIISCGLVAAGGLVVGHLMRNLGLETIYGRAASEEASGDEDAETAESTTNMSRYRGLNMESTSATDPISFLEHFKLVYRNETGGRVATTLPSLFGTIERTFLANDINLAACIQKSLCTLVHKSRENVRLQRANEYERLIDGAVSWSWLTSWLQQTALHEAIDAAKHTRRFHCDLTYPACKWSAPEQRLWDLLRTNVRFA